MTITRLSLIMPAGLAILLATTAASCDTTSGSPAGSSTPSSAAQNLAIGKALKVSDSSGASAFVTVESVTYATKGTGPIAQPPAHGMYAVVNVLFQDDAGQYTTNPLYVKFQTADGTTTTAFDGNSISAGFDPTLGTSTLNPGQKTRGNVVFDVKSKGGLIQVTDPLFQVVGQWTAPIQ